MKKLFLFLIATITFVACSSKVDLTRYQQNSNGILYYLDMPQPDSYIQVYTAPDNKDIITKLKITTTFSKKIVSDYYKQDDFEKFLIDRNEQQVRHLKSDMKNIDHYANYAEITKDNKEPLPFFSATYSYDLDALYNMEILSFNFCLKNLNLSDKHYQDLLARYGLSEAYDKNTGFLSFKKLLQDKSFEFQFYFEKGIKQTL